jgi:RNA polymerase sigma-70 factor (ECF subfamily)
MDEVELIRGVKAREPRALAALHDRFAQPVLRILRRILGPDLELEDLHHDVFVRALRSLGELRDPAALPGWLCAIAVHTAHAAIERRVRRRRWTFLARQEALPEPAPFDPHATFDAREALRSTYALLDRLPAEERVVFALRFIDGMELSEVARVCRVSLATTKRRLARAEERFRALARRAPALATYLERGARWTSD